MTADPAGHVPLGNPDAVATLLYALREAGAEHQVGMLAARAARHAPLDNPYAVDNLLRALRRAGAEQQADALIARDPAGHVSLDRASSVTRLLRALREAGAEQQADALIARMPAEGQFSLSLEQSGNREQYRFGREPDGSKAPRWGWDDLDD
jgi:hypothetical protein